MASGLGSAAGQRCGGVGGEPGQAVAAQVAVAHAEGLEEPLLSHRQADEIAQLDPGLADDDLWAELHRHFTEPELVELGYFIGLTMK